MSVTVFETECIGYTGGSAIARQREGQERTCARSTKEIGLGLFVRCQRLNTHFRSVVRHQEGNAEYCILYLNIVNEN